MQKMCEITKKEAGCAQKHLSLESIYVWSDLRQRGGEVVAVFVHQVVGAATKFFAQLLHDFIDVLLREVCSAQHNGLPVWRAQDNGRMASALHTCQF